MKAWIRALFYRALFPVAKLFLITLGLRRDGALVIISWEGKMLLIKNTYGSRYWTFPGGTMRRGESSEDAAKREVHEEVGILLKEIKLISSLRGKHGTVHVFTGDSFGGKLILDRGEVLDAKWIVPDQIKENELSDVGAVAFKNFKSYKIGGLKN